MTRTEFLKTPEQSVNRKNIKSCAICGYVVAGIFAVYYTFKFQKAWKEYRESDGANLDE